MVFICEEKEKECLLSVLRRIFRAKTLSLLSLDPPANEDSHTLAKVPSVHKISYRGSIPGAIYFKPVPRVFRSLKSLMAN